MGVFVGSDSRVVVQGITGSEGRFHAKKMKEYGTDVVAGVTPGKEGQKLEKIPIYNTIGKAVERENANTSIIFVPPRFAGDAIMESLDADLDLVVAITEHIPVHDMVKVKRRISEVDTTLIGPNCPGVITPSESKVGIMPGSVFEKGNIGIISRSGTLTYEISDSLKREGYGQSTVVGVGGDPIIGASFKDVLSEFKEDDSTDAIVLVGEIGGSDEEEAAKWIEKNMQKPVVAFIAGLTAPPGKRMGHAGAIISGSSGTAESKIKAFENCNIPTARTPKQIAEKIGQAL